jgi:uncharacterized protein YlxP (DUF503 family)
MVVGLLRLEVHVPNARTLKDKRSVLNSLKDQLRGRFNISVAEVDANETWQRATVGISTLGNSRAYAEGLLREVTAWVRNTRLIELIAIEEEYL